MSYKEKDLEKELLTTAFDQFAENQRAKEQTFLKILGFLGSVLLGFSLTYHGYINSDVGIHTFSLVVLASSFLLFGGSWVIIIIGYSFRRDQYVKNEIGKKAKIEANIHPERYNPFSIYTLKKNKKIVNFFMKRSLKKYFRTHGFFSDKIGYNLINFSYLRWLPDLFIVYYGLFPLFLVLIIIIYSTCLDWTFDLKLWFSTLSLETFLLNIVFYITVFLLILLLFLPIKYSNKLLQRLSVWNGYIPYDYISGKKQSIVDEIFEVQKNLIREIKNHGSKSNEVKILEKQKEVLKMILEIRTIKKNIKKDKDLD